MQEKKLENNMVDVSIIVPCYNEEKNVENFIKTLNKNFKGKIKNYEVIFVNDGSKDNTLKKLEKSINENMKIINFSKNFGKESAMFAGLKEANGRYVAIIDADLQQNPKYLLDMKKILDEHLEYDEVAAYQEKRKEKFLIKFLKTKFYKVMSEQTNLDVGKTTSDFRMFRRNVLEAVLSLSEKSRFSKGIFAYVGFNIFYMPYQVKEREHGKSTWNLSKLFNYAINGITDFSVKPLLWQIKFGIFQLIVSMILLIIFACNRLNSAWIVFAIILIVTAIQNILSGINNFYVGKILIETKDRPTYIIKDIIKGKK